VRREALQWFGLFGAPLAWTAQHVLGYGFAEGACHSGGMLWGIDPRAWEIAITSVAAAVALAAGLAALAVFRATRGCGEGEPPASRLHFFSVASLAVVPIFLAAIVMSGVGVAYYGGCSQS
jgi:hypothetical protein